MAKDEISEEGRKARFEQWERLGLDRVKHGLLNDPHATIGGPPQVRELAWEWVRRKEAELAEQAERARAKAAEEKPAELVTLKPTFYGVGINLKEGARRIKERFERHKKPPQE